MTEILKVDPNFDKDVFLLEMEHDVIPNVLEAMIRPDLRVLKDWSSEMEFARAKQRMESLALLGHVSSTRILDVDQVELFHAKIHESRPIFILRFAAQVLNHISDE